MTDKKENILQTALELFAREGYNAVSTNKIARKAGVSEGLIFRHFGSKKGLLEAIMADVETRVAQLLAPIIFEEDPVAVIRKVILLPFEVDQSEYDYWKLQHKLKWEQEYNNPRKMKPLIDKLTWAFSERGADEPAKEAQLLSQIIDVLAIGILQNGLDSQLPLRSLLLNKYQV